MSRMSDLSIKKQEEPERECHPTPQEFYFEAFSSDCALPKQSKTTNGRYWELCYDVVLAAGKVVQQDKLLTNYLDERKKHTVKPIVENKKHYPKGEKSVREARITAVVIFFNAVEALNRYAQKIDREPVSGTELLGMLFDKNMRTKFKLHISNHIQNGYQPFPLNELPLRDFRR